MTVLYISQNADILEKWRNFSIKMSPDWLFIQIRDHLKRNACQHLYFKISLYISPNADMLAKWRNFCINMSSNWFSMLHFYISFKFVTIKKKACHYLYLMIYFIFAKMPTCRQNDVIFSTKMSANWFFNVAFVYQF